MFHCIVGSQTHLDDMFRPYKVILRPSKKTDPRALYVSLHSGITDASGHVSTL